jgi:hypothetical protein
VKRTLDPAVEMLLNDMRINRMYGSVEIKFEAGRVVLLKRTETIKPESRDNRDGDDYMTS